MRERTRKVEMSDRRSTVGIIKFISKQETTKSFSKDHRSKVKFVFGGSNTEVVNNLNLQHIEIGSRNVN
jgi:hypothetical protein